MSIFHLSVNIIKKQGKNGKIHSVIASAAYRHRCTMSAVTADLKTAQTYNYKKKNSDLIDEFLIYPTHKNKFLNSIQNEPIATQSELIWQQIELQEKRKDAQFAREVELSLHHDLTLEQNKALLQKFINENFTKLGMIADVVIHNPKQKNLHAHILLSMRDIDTSNNPLKIFNKKNRDWNNPDLVNQWRESWEHLSNAAFAEHSVNAEISCKTLAKQREIALLQGNYQKAAELDREPAKHILKEEFSLPSFDDQDIKFDFEKALKTRTEKRK